MTVNEPGALIEYNLRWHMATGAAAMWVFTDDPHDAAADLPCCHSIISDAALWAAYRNQLSFVAI